MIVGSPMVQVRGFVQITRFTNSVYAAVYTVVGAYLAGGVAAVLRPGAWVASLVVGLVVAYGFVINDYMDVLVDSYSKPYRPIPAGVFSRRAALLMAAGLALLAMLTASALGPGMALFAAGTIALAAVYSLALKGTVLWGNACMAVLIGAILVYGALSAGAAPPLVWIMAGLMWLFDFSHEILKTTADHAGDRQAGLRTVATALGVSGAVRAFQVAALLFCLVALLPWLLGLAPTVYLLALIPCAILPTLAVVLLLARGTSDAAITLALKIMRYMWISNLLPIIFARP